MTDRPFLTIRFVDSFFFSLDLRYPGDVRIAQCSFPSRDMALEVGLARARGNGLALFEEDGEGKLSPIHDPAA
jgi:hypothetical protein